MLVYISINAFSLSPFFVYIFGVACAQRKEPRRDYSYGINTFDEKCSTRRTFTKRNQINFFPLVTCMCIWVFSAFALHRQTTGRYFMALRRKTRRRDCASTRHHIYENRERLGAVGAIIITIIAAIITHSLAPHIYTSEMGNATKTGSLLRFVWLLVCFFLYTLFQCILTCTVRCDGKGAVLRWCAWWWDRARRYDSALCFPACVSWVVINSIYNIENIYFYLNFLFATYYGYSREIARLTNRSIIDGLGFSMWWRWTKKIYKIKIHMYKTVFLLN